MDDKKARSINSLMKIMRDNKHININGSLQKKNLRYMGYFHGYKGYRYFGKPSVLINYSDFNQLQAVYDFDMELKSILYPQIMFLETAIKNYVLECVLDESKSLRFADIYAKQLNAHKSFSTGNNKYTKAIGKRLELREHVYNAISRAQKRNLVTHYYDKDQPVPIWGIFELLSMGELANFIDCLNKSTKLKISKSIGFKSSDDPEGRMIKIVVYTLKDLRNAVAHNGTIFDTRFKSGNINDSLSNYIKKETAIKDIDFTSIVDYFVLIVFMLKLFGKNKTEILAFVKQFENSCEALRSKIPMNIYSSILYTNTRGKVQGVKEFI